VFTKKFSRCAVCEKVEYPSVDTLFNNFHFEITLGTFLLSGDEIRWPLKDLGLVKCFLWHMILIFFLKVI